MGPDTKEIRNDSTAKSSALEEIRRLEEEALRELASELQREIAPHGVQTAPTIDGATLSKAQNADIPLPLVPTTELFATTVESYLHERLVMLTRVFKAQRVDARIDVAQSENLGAKFGDGLESIIVFPKLNPTTSLTLRLHGWKFPPGIFEGNLLDGKQPAGHLRLHTINASTGELWVYVEANTYLSHEVMRNLQRLAGYC